MTNQTTQQAQIKKTYSKVSGSGVPAGWREVKLGEVAKFSQGIQVPIDLQQTKPSENSVRFIRIVDFTKNDFSDLRYIKNPGERYLVKEDDLVMIRYGSQTAGKIARGFDGAIANNTFKIIVDELALNKDFTFYFLKQKSIYSYFKASQSSSTMPAITFDMIGGLKISLPPLPEQKAIAEVLGSIDDKIDLLHRQNKTLEDMAQALFRKWFIDEVDEGWEVGKLGDVIEIFDSKRVPLSKMQRDKMKEGKLYPYYGAAQIMDYVNDYIFDGEYILLGEDGTVKTSAGYPVLQYATGKFWVNNHTHILQAKKPYTNFFVWHFLLKKNINNIITGAVQPKISQTNLKSLDFPKFPLGLAMRFQNNFSDTFQKILKNQSQIRTLENLRDTLLPKLTSGEVRVRF